MLSIFFCVCTYIGKRLESEFASQANFMLKPHMMLCPDGIQREEKNSDFICIFISVYMSNALPSLNKGQENTKIFFLS